MCREELEHDYEKKNEKPLQSANFIILMRTKTVNNESKRRYAKLEIFDFQFFYSFVYYMTKHVPNIDFVIM